MTKFDAASLEGKALGLWNRPGGKLKGVLLVLGFLAVGYFLLPKLTVALDNTTEFFWGITHAAFAIGVTIASVALLWGLLTSKRVRAICLALWDLVIDWTIGLIIPYNPKVLARRQVDANFEEVEKLEANVDEVAGEEEKAKTQLDKNNKQLVDIDKEMKQKAALSRNQEQMVKNSITVDMILGQISVLENRKNRYIDWNSRLEPLYLTISDTRKKLNQLAGYARTKAQIFKEDVEMQILEYESMSSASNAAKRFANVLSGKNDRSYMGEKALMFMKDKLAKDSGDLKQILRRSKDFTNSLNLENATYDQAALDYLNQFNTKYIGEGVTTPIEVVSSFTNPNTVKTKYDNL